MEINYKGIDLSECKTDKILGITGDSETAYIETVPLTLKGQRLYVETRLMKTELPDMVWSDSEDF